MNRKTLFKLFVVSIITTCCTIFVNGQDFSQWMGENRDGKVSGFVAPDTWPESLTLKWNIEVGSGDASPVLKDGKIYLHSMVDNNDVLRCIDAENGKEIWLKILNQSPQVTGPAASHPGPRSTPAIYKGKIYTLGTAGIVICQDVNTGEVIWENEEYTGFPEFYTSSSPLLVNDLCICQLGGKDDGVVVAFDVATGKETWKLEDVPCTYSSPVMMNTFDGMMLVQSETELSGVTLDGKQLWEIPMPVETRFYNCATPIYQDDVLVITGQGLGTKAYKLEKSGSGWDTNRLWMNSELGISFNTPLIKNGYIFGHEARLGYLYSINLETGETGWLDDTPLNRFGSILDLGDVLLSLTGKGKLIFFEPDGSEYKELANYTVTDNDVYAYPIVSGNRIYTKDLSKLACWEIK